MEWHGSELTNRHFTPLLECTFGDRSKEMRPYFSELELFLAGKAEEMIKAAANKHFRSCWVVAQYWQGKKNSSQVKTLG